jgi:hypothetical protein
VINKQLNNRTIHRLSSLLVAASAVALAMMLLAAAPSFAATEQVATFGGVLVAPIPAGEFPEDAQLGGAMGSAINVNGTGGVTPGTVYVAAYGFQGQELKIDRYSPTGQFELAWTEALVRCGPVVPGTPCPSRADGTEKAEAGVAVDQATGDVYVYVKQRGPGGENQIHVYNPSGTETIAEFGPKAHEGSTIVESPSEFHGSFDIPSPIAVDPSGRVYVFDAEASGAFDYRLMEFEPETPGHYEHYVYAGESKGAPSRAKGLGGELSTLPSRPSLDDAGDVYTAGGEGSIEKYDPRGSTPTLLCSFRIKDGGGRGITVNPVNGDVYYYDYKNREVHRLSGQCDSEGHFTQIESFPPNPTRGTPQTMAFNPSLTWEEGDPPGVLYVVAPNAQGEAGGGESGAGSIGYIFAPAVSHAPVISTTAASQVGSNSAVLSALVNPRRSATTYSFEYLTDAAYQANEPSERFAGAKSAPIGGASLSGSAPASVVSVTLTGLTPQTEYHYRIVATNAGGTTEGPSLAFDTFATEAPGLPDGRDYELVTPIDKHGGQPFPLNYASGACGGCKPGEATTHFPIVSSQNGEGLAYQGSSFTGQGGAIENEYLAKRSPSGWHTEDLSPSTQETGEGDGFKALGSELGQALIYQGRGVLAPAAPEGYANLYAQDTAAASALTPLLSEAPFNRSPGGAFVVSYAGASADLSAVFLEANDALTHETAVAPAAVDGGMTKSNLYEWRDGRLSLVNVAPGNASTAPGGGFGSGRGSFEATSGFTHAISEDGTHAFWSSESGQAYVRIDGERTVEIPDHTGRFVTASATGSQVLLNDGRIYGDLDSGAPVEEADLTEGKGGFVEVVGQSEDLSYVYFLDTAVLTETPNAEGAAASNGARNLYAWHSGSLVYVATLAPGDSTEKTAQASPDGSWLAIHSLNSLTGFDNLGPCGNGKTEPCPEIYLYGAEAGTLTCPSCSTSKATPQGPSQLPLLRGQGTSPQPHYLTDSGRVFFDSQNELVGADNNGRAEDVYEYEPDAVGTCVQAGGCVSMISAGTGADSNFLAMDPSGKNVFFTTRDRLLASDRDDEIDVYDAREGGGIVPTPEPDECKGEACQALPPTPGGEPAPGSLTFFGPTNLLAPLVPAPAVKPATKAPTRAQKLAAALKACKKKPKRSRLTCQRRARKRFAAKATAKTTPNDRKKA